MPVLAITITIFGVCLCLPLLLILSAWVLREWYAVDMIRKQFRQWQTEMRAELDRKESGVRQRKSDSISVANTARWTGWRKFRVARMQSETETATSIWIEPIDGKPIADFLPGQFLTIRLPARSNKSQPLVRCYSLSGPIDSNRYQLTVRRVDYDDNSKLESSVSSWINSGMMEGDSLDAKAPRGDFVLDEKTSAPVVLLAAGVGITPLAPMIHRLLVSSPDRKIVLVYGNKNGSDHIFRDWLAKTARQNDRLMIVDCYTRPEQTERLGQDYQIAGRINIDLLRKILPNQKFQFYICGPSAFMQSMYDGLLDWGVLPERIRYEAFGPASVGRVKSEAQAPSAENTTTSEPVPIVFRTSNQTCETTDQERSILEMAESLSVEIASGCRSGNCGSCAVKLLKGKVQYRVDPSAEIEPGFCLTCIAVANSPVELEA